MSRSLASGLLDKDLDAHYARCVREAETLSGVGGRDLSTLSLLSGAFLLPATLPEARVASTGKSRRLSRAYLPQRARAMHTTAHIHPFFGNSGTANLQSERPTALHPRRKLPRHASRNRRLSIFDQT
jgi:hypothetical protein